MSYKLKEKKHQNILSETKVATKLTKIISNKESANKTAAQPIQNKQIIPFD